MKELKDFLKNLTIVVLALYFYFAVLFIIGYALTRFSLHVSNTVFGLPLTEALISTTAIIGFALAASLDLYLVSKKKWSPAMVILLIPVIIFGFIKSIIKKTSFTIDTSQTPREYEGLDNSFKNVFRPIRRHF